MCKLRQVIRCRATLVVLGSNCRSQIHAALGRLGLQVATHHPFGAPGLRLLDDIALPRCTWKRVSSLRALVEARTAELRELGATIQRRLGAHAGCPTIQLLRGVGAVAVAEMGEVTSLAQDAAPGSSAGLAPPHREPDRSVKSLGVVEFRERDWGQFIRQRARR